MENLDIQKAEYKSAKSRKQNNSESGDSEQDVKSRRSHKTQKTQKSKKSWKEKLSYKGPSEYSHSKEAKSEKIFSKHSDKSRKTEKL